MYFGGAYAPHADTISIYRTLRTTTENNITQFRNSTVKQIVSYIGLELPLKDK